MGGYRDLIERNFTVLAEVIFGKCCCNGDSLYLVADATDPQRFGAIVTGFGTCVSCDRCVTDACIDETGGLSEGELAEQANELAEFFRKQVQWGTEKELQRWLHGPDVWYLWHFHESEFSTTINAAFVEARAVAAGVSPVSSSVEQSPLVQLIGALDTFTQHVTIAADILEAVTFTGAAELTLDQHAAFHDLAEDFANRALTHVIGRSKKATGIGDGMQVIEAAQRAAVQWHSFGMTGGDDENPDMWAVSRAAIAAYTWSTIVLGRSETSARFVALTPLRQTVRG